MINIFRRRENRPDTVREKAAKRLSKLSSTEVGIYGEVHLAEVGRALTIMQRQPSPEAVAEYRKNVSVLAAIGDVLVSRTPQKSATADQIAATI